MDVKSCTIFKGPELDAERIMPRNLHGGDPSEVSSQEGTVGPGDHQRGQLCLLGGKKLEDPDPNKTEGKLATNWKKITALLQGGLTTACHHILTSNKF